MPKVIVEDFERRRRARETASERVVCIVVAASMAALVLTESIWSARFASNASPTVQELAVLNPVRLVTALTLVAHLAVFLLLALWPAYEPSRKYLLVTMRVVLMGCMCWAQWYSPNPSFGLLVPSIIGILVIVDRRYDQRGQSCLHRCQARRDPDRRFNAADAHAARGHARSPGAGGGEGKGRSSFAPSDSAGRSACRMRHRRCPS